MRGFVVQTDAPNWEPLEAAIGSDIVGWFMWMHEIQLGDGSRLHAYKHVTTRRYLHLAGDGCAYDYRGDSQYAVVRLAWAIARAFGGWERARPSDGQVQALHAAVESARDLTT